MPLPYAKQTLSSTDKVVREGICPEHEKSSRLFIGVVDYNTTVAWQFKCKQNLHPHMFVNYADRGSPKTREEAIEWMKNQKMARIQSLDVNKKRKK